MTGKVALTLDDGPDPVWTPRVLDALVEAGARATFFVVARAAREHRPLLRRAEEEGHEIGLHCVRHVRHDRMSGPEILADAREGLGVLRDLGHEALAWRTPWGVVTEDTVGVARRLSLRLVGWTADSEDWRGDPPQAMLSRLEPYLVDGAVVLMHDGVGPGAARTGCADTVELVGPLVSELGRRGLEPVPLRDIEGPVPDRNPRGVSRV